MPSNMNLMQASKKLEHVKAEVRTRTDRGKDDNGDLNSELFKYKNPDVELMMGDWLGERYEEAEKLQREVNEYMKTEGILTSFDQLDEFGKQKGHRPPTPGGGKMLSLADALIKSEEFEAFYGTKGIKGRAMTFDHEIGLKTLFETTTAAAADNVSVESIRTGEFVMAPRTRVTLLDIIPQAETAFPVVKYDEETKNLSGVRPVAQGAIYTPSEFTIEEKSVNVDKAGTFIQVSEEALQDRPELQSRMNGSLMSQMYRRMQTDIVGGTLQNAGEYTAGAAANLNITGLLDIASANINEIDAQTGYTSGNYKNEIECIEEGAEMVYRLGIAEADAILMNSLDWVKVKTLQSTTGSFVLRGANAPLWMPVQRQIDDWPVVLCNALPVGTVVIGAYREHSQIRDRQAVQVRIQESVGVPGQTINTSTPQATLVVVETVPTGRFNIYSDMRYAFYVRRGLAFTRITNFGIPVP